MIRKIALEVLAFACVLAYLPVNLDAQSTFGSVRGNVVDQSGAAIPGAAITLHSVDENSNISTLSNDSGNFVFENVRPGHYALTGAKEGFARAVVNQVELVARQDLRLDITLALAVQAQTVEVNASTVGVNTENATLSDSKDSADISQLPINSRAVSSSPLAALAVSPSVTRDSQGNFAVGGATSSQTGFSVDGISTASVRYNGALQDAYPSMENIAEMKVTAFNNNAEFAQISDVTFVTKSGTNLLHGSAFEYFQDGALDATVLNFSFKAPRTFNTFGGSLGGPVSIPKLYNGRDKRFSSWIMKETEKPSPTPSSFWCQRRQREKAI